MLQGRKAPHLVEARGRKTSGHPRAANFIAYIKKAIALLRPRRNLLHLKLEFALDALGPHTEALNVGEVVRLRGAK